MPGARSIQRTLLVVGMLVGLSACATPGVEPSGDVVRVVTTVSPITNIVQNVGGDRIFVTGIVPEGANSHTFDPSPSDARALAEADIVFMNGLNLEEPTRVLAEANVRPGVPIVALAESALTPDEYVFDFSFPRSGGEPNPHVWTSPLRAKRFVTAVRDRLAGLRPADEATFRANADRFLARLDALDAAARAVSATVPEANRKLLTYHDSFPYFARDYGWTIIGAIQPVDFGEPTPREVKALIDQVKRLDVPAIFGSEVFSSPVLERIADATGARYVDELRDDDLPGDQGDPAHSYIGLMVFDFRTFMGALGGDTAALDALDTSDVAGDASTARYRR